MATRPSRRLRLCVLAVFSVALLFTPGAARAIGSGFVGAWGCTGPNSDYGQCSLPSGLSGVTAISAGDSHNLALMGNGTVIAWGCVGFGNRGQCDVPTGLGGVIAIAAGFSDSLALKGDGTVVAWGCSGGNGIWGQCSVPSGLSGVTAIAASGYHSLALKGDGTVVAWGCGSGSDFGQCSVPGGLSGVTAIAASVSDSLALKGDGTVVAWGCGKAFGGDSGDFGQCNVPAGLSGVTAIAAGNGHSLALKDDGTVVAWGCIGGGVDFGQCKVPDGLSGVTAIAATQWHSLALKSNGTVIAWGCAGSSNFGQCTVPSWLCDVSAIAAGTYHSLALFSKACQTISFGPIANRTFGDPDFGVSGTASSGLPVAFAASGSCSVSGESIHLTGAGSCTITASQRGDANYNAAPDVSRGFAIAKAEQSISFGQLVNRTFGAPDFRVSAAASSGLVISLRATGNCIVSASIVHLTGSGSCTLIASQPGDANYNAAADVSRTFAIVPQPCRVPKVVGQRAGSAKRMIARKHCRTGNVGYAYSRRRKSGIVISQSRRPGQVLPPGSKINLVVSLGRRR